MALNVEIAPHILEFRFQAKTSRGSLKNHKTWYLKIWDDIDPGSVGYGECAPFEGLSVDDRPDFEDKLEIEVIKIRRCNIPTSVEEVNTLVEKIDIQMPSVRFGFETALRDLFYKGRRKIFDSPFYDERDPITINGLVWMGDKLLMLERLENKIARGFDCIKLKIGAINWQDELGIIQKIREKEGGENLCIRVDANGAFKEPQVYEILDALHQLNVHSIEQPIKAGQVEDMKGLCRKAPVPVALDEELIGVKSIEDKRRLLETIRPQFIVLKPTLLGGFMATEEWINLAEELDIGWWITSALESNIGLNAICQFTSTFKNPLPQGLGTGGLYKNNIPSPLTIDEGKIFYATDKTWQLELIEG
ncbi:MAG: o-succinylbenzoate synthase [Bacteroidota bacterium]